MVHLIAFLEENYYVMYVLVLLLLCGLCWVAQTVKNSVKAVKSTTCSNVANTKYPSLAPTDNYDPIKPYEEVLEHNIDQESSKNIALSGPYGSGKSSILKTFFKNKINKYKNRVIYVSLAAFCESDNEDGNSDANTNDLQSGPLKQDSPQAALQRQLELSILQQLIYHVTPQDIPQSRFKRIRHISERTIIFHSIAFLILLFSIGTIIFNPFAIFLVNNTWGVICLALVQAAATLIAIFFISDIYRFLSKLSWVKINIPNIELEVSQKDGASILNRHLDEIIYYFEVGSADIVIFEDLDRFETTEIFQKLREINLLLNSAKQIDRKITFIYALRDDVFKNEDRTKFFDFMIPVVPIINISNSGDKLISFFDAHKNLIRPETSFISEIANFVDSMRLLNSICSEYMIYQDVLNASKLPPENLFSMIVFKNLYPKDFVELHNNKGDLPTIFEKKREFVYETKIKIETDIKFFEDKITAIENEWVKNIQEIRLLYLAYAGKKFNGHEISLSSSYNGFRSIFDYSDDSLWESFYSTDPIYFRNRNNNYGAQHNIFDTIEQELGKYEERIEQIAETKNSYIEKYQREISKLKKQRSTLSIKTFAELITEYQHPIKVADSSKIRFLRFVLTNGYINENYHTYISFFHEGSLTQTDNEFIISVIGQVQLPYEYKIENVENVVKKISIEHFKKKSILNFRLVEYIFMQPETKFADQRNLLIEQLCVLDQTEFTFIDQFIEYSLNAATNLFEYIGKKRHDFWRAICKEPAITSERQKLYFAILTKACFDFIQELDSEQEITNYLSSLEHICKFSEEYDCFESLQEILATLPVKIQHLDIPQTAGETAMFMHIYKNNLYAINSENVQKILSILLRDKFNVTRFQTKNLTYIYETGDNHLISYINENIALYISNTASGLQKQNDDVSILIKLLNNENIGIEQRLSFLARQEKSLDDISPIENNEILERIVRNGLMNISWKNIQTYFEKNSCTLTDALIACLNIPDVFEALGSEKITYDKSTEEAVTAMIIAILKSEKLTEKAITYLQAASPFRWRNFNIDKLSVERVKTLMQKKNFVLNEENFSQIKEHGFAGHITLIEQNSVSFLAVCDKLPIDTQDWKLILQSSIPVELKQEIIAKKYPVLLESNEIISAMVPIVSEHYRIYWNIEILKACSAQMNNAERKKCLLHQLKVRDFEKKEAVQLIAQLPEPLCKLAQPGTRPTLPQNDDSRFLLGLVRGWDMTSKVDDSKKNVICVTMKYFDPIV